MGTVYSVPNHPGFYRVRYQSDPLSMLFGISYFLLGMKHGKHSQQSPTGNTSHYVG